MSDTQNDGEIIGFLPGGIEVRTAHGADGKFISGSGGGGGVSASKAASHLAIAAHFKAKAGKTTHSERKHAYLKSAEAHEKSATAWKEGTSAAHANAAHAHSWAAGSHGIISGRANHSTGAQKTHKADADAHNEHHKEHKAHMTHYGSGHGSFIGA